VHQVGAIGPVRRSQRIALLVLVHQIEAQADDDNDQQTVAAEVGGEGDEVARLVPVEEDLRACTI
jgi:hypothetical protein